MELIVVAAMVAMNSVFAGYEIALASIGVGRLHALAEQGRRGAASAVRMKQNMEGSLAVVQLGITLVGAVAAATGGAGAAESIEPLLRSWGVSVAMAQLLAVALVVAPLTVVTIVLGELVPKLFALRNQEWVCLTLSPPMAWFSRSVHPLVWLLETSASLIVEWGERSWSGASGRPRPEEPLLQELHGAAAGARLSRLIGHHEEGIIVSASRLAATPLRKIMLPAEFIGMLVADQPLSTALITAHQQLHTRFPVTKREGDPQQIVGYVNFKDIVAAMRLAPRDPSLRNLVRELRSFDADMSVATCLEHLMRDRNHIALVRDSGAKVVGMITLEDVVEELVGEIHDEFDRIPTHLTPTGPGWTAGGFVSLNQLRDTAGMTLQPMGDKPIYTLSDWIVERLGRPPRGGDQIEADGCRVVVRKTRQTLVQEALVTPLETDANK